MEITDFKGLSGDGYDQIIDKVKAAAPPRVTTPAEALLQMDPKEHDVMKQGKRPDKVKEVEDEDGKKSQSTVFVARLPISLQKLIVRRAAAFLCGNPITLDAQPDGDQQSNFLELLKKVWEDNKLDYKSMDLAKMMMAETQCAELWYTQEAEAEYWAGTANQGAKFKLRVKILAPSKGDELYPVYDATGDMIAFGRGYKVKVDDEEIEHFDLYTNDTTYLGTKGETDWEVDPKPNMVKKIPIIYYTQPYPEWYDVEDLIKRLETVNSNAADTNDYFASPIVALSGEVHGLGDKEDSGKVIELENGAKAEYLTWDRAPEATKMEIENLERYIYDLTDTPNISFREMQKLGTFSGVALKMLFLSAHMKAAEKEGVFGEGVQRRINFLKVALSTTNTSLASVAAMIIKPRFEYYLPKNDQETIQLLTEAVGPGKAIMSQENAIRQNPLVGNADAEIEQMREEGVLGSDIATA